MWTARGPWLLPIGGETRLISWSVAVAEDQFAPALDLVMQEIPGLHIILADNRAPPMGIEKLIVGHRFDFGLGLWSVAAHRPLSGRETPVICTCSGAPPESYQGASQRSWSQMVRVGLSGGQFHGLISPNWLPQ
jgi:hypothetical protein